MRLKIQFQPLTSLLLIEDGYSVIGRKEYVMDRFLFIFGIVVFAISLFILIMNFIGEYNGLTLIVSIIGMLNASIAIGVSEILSKMKT